MVKKNKKKGSANSRKNGGNGSSTRVLAPVAQGLISRSSRPNIRNMNGTGDIIVSHSEFIADFGGSVAFLAASIQINPGLSEMFPWLSAVARRYESYRFKKLNFRFESQAPTTAGGSLMLGIDYDAAEAAPTTKQQIMSYRNSVRCPPWASVTHSSSLKDLSKLNTYFVRSAVLLAANLDIKSYDVGNLFVARQGEADTSTIGELYVDYIVELMTPQLGTDIPFWRSESDGTGVTTTNLFGTTATVFAGSNIDVTLAATGIIFQQSFEGIATVSIAATTLTTVAIGAGSATEVLEATSNIVASVPPVSSTQFTISAVRGDSFTPTAVTVTAPSVVIWRLAAYNFAAS